MNREAAEASHPTERNLTLGFALAPLVPSLVVSCGFSWLMLGRADPSPPPGAWLGALAISFVSALMYAYPTGLFLGLLAYGLFIDRIPPRAPIIMMVGGLVALAPLIFADCVVWIGVLPEFLEQRAPPVQLDWEMTFEFAKVAAGLFGLGAMGGAVFWICVFRRPS